MTENERLALSEAADQKCWSKRKRSLSIFFTQSEREWDDSFVRRSFRIKGKVLSMSPLYPYVVNCENIAYSPNISSRKDVLHRRDDYISHLKIT